MPTDDSALIRDRAEHLSVDLMKFHICRGKVNIWPELEVHTTTIIDRKLVGIYPQPAWWH